ncbi:MAG: hypothetical protein RBS76_03225 [Acholeplasmatales bacterium]|jgi:hypothetical protein|nr:hypothetical protein [Acholeplasmataceae bacterium]MCK9234145.1 hypothetical protein [Acholeplasmataceae bacterium]MDY0115494.1 hypothetical protein [Acholeplasmatales bacterium]HHT39244.1 hypothetical protein [Acholeplasmataceae bacterium]
MAPKEDCALLILKKQENLLSYVNTADEQILNQIGLITSAREAFSEAFKNHDEQESFENFQTIETTFLGLLSYLEDILTIGLQSV